jgi:four helix bundle protein
MAYSSSRELQYQLSLARRLGYLPAEQAEELESTATETAKVLNGLIRALRKPSQA